MRSRFPQALCCYLLSWSCFAMMYGRRALPTTERKDPSSPVSISWFPLYMDIVLRSCRRWKNAMNVFSRLNAILSWENFCRTECSMRETERDWTFFDSEMQFLGLQVTLFMLIFREESKNILVIVRPYQQQSPAKHFALTQFTSRVIVWHSVKVFFVNTIQKQAFNLKYGNTTLTSTDWIFNFLNVNFNTTFTLAS